MSKQKIYLSCSALVLIAALLTWSIVWLRSYRETTEVIVLNVGEGDAILISQGSNQVLIDGGRSGKELLSRVGRRVPFWDRTIETIIATHPDADHIGGFAALLGAYRVRMFLYTGAESDTETSSLLRKALAANHTDVARIFRGGSVRFPYGGELAIEYPLTPLPAEMRDTNSGSIVGRFTYGATRMLLTGDLPNEETVLPDTQKADILKVAHHGSRYSTSADFLDRVKPEEAVISVGKNSYGHPSPDVLGRLAERSIVVRRTDTDGDVAYLCTLELARCVARQP
ncbi:MAG: MBL fold metallo-hydrolase [Candidatus Moraniibacteriota bacterium]